MERLRKNAPRPGVDMSMKGVSWMSVIRALANFQNHLAEYRRIKSRDAEVLRKLAAELRGAADELEKRVT